MGAAEESRRVAPIDLRIPRALFYRIIEQVPIEERIVASIDESNLVFWTFNGRQVRLLIERLIEK